MKQVCRSRARVCWLGVVFCLPVVGSACRIMAVSPPMKNFFPFFSLRPRNKKKKRVREGVFHRVGGPPTPSIYFGLFVRAICLRLLGGRLHSYLQRGSLFFFFLNSRIVNFCSNGGQIETGFHLFTFLTGISRCCELVQQPTKIYAF